MSKVKLKDLSNSHFQHGLRILSTSEKIPAVIAYRLSFVVEEISEALEKVDKARNDIAAKYAEKGEDGKPKRERLPTGQETYNIPLENRDTLEQEFKEFLEEEIDLPDPKVKMTDLWPHILDASPPAEPKEDLVKVPALSMRKIVGILVLEA